MNVIGDDHMDNLTASGVLAISHSPDIDIFEPKLSAALPEAATRTRVNPSTTIITWGSAAPPTNHSLSLVRGENPSPGVAFDADLSQMELPPSATISTERGSLEIAVDWLGFRHVYETSGQGWHATSTSARLLAHLTDAGLDRAAISAHVLLGWQLDLRTPFAGVSKLAAGSVTRFDPEVGRTTTIHPRKDPERKGFESTVKSAAKMLRQIVNDCLDEHPDAVLQLTGGLDSRTLLAAIPRARRSSVSAMTLDVPGSADTHVATALTDSHGMDHELITLDGLADVDPDEAYERTLYAASRLDCSTDPIAFAALQFAEEKSNDRKRIEGLGGEVTRGFYYYGPNFSPPFHDWQVKTLAKWRLFANGSVPESILVADFAEFANSVTMRSISNTLNGSGQDWLEATDTLYLDQRMHRWAGVLSSATCFDRVVINPMLAEPFLLIATGLAPRYRRNAMFLASLLVELDEDLARIPLEGRPPPVFYTRPPLRTIVPRVSITARKFARKSLQRARGVRLPPAGGEILSGKVADHLRSNPQLIEPLLGLDILDDRWIEEFVQGRSEATPATIGLIASLLSATDAVAGNYSSRGPSM